MINLLPIPLFVQTPTLEPWLAALNSGRYETIRAYHAAAPWKEEAADLAGRDFGLVRRSGGFQLVRTLPDRAGRKEALLRAKALDEIYVLSLGDTPGWRPPMRNEVESEVPPATAATLGRRIQRYVDSVARAGRFNGSFAVLKDGRVLAKGSYGLAHRGYQVPNRWDTKFNLGSMPKMFTAIAIGQLIEKGMLTLDTKVGEVLPDYPNAAVREQVTVRMLLNHTSGIGDYFTPAFIEGSKDRWKSIDQILPLFVDQPLRFPAGERHAYSNAGFVLLGRILEKLHREDYWKIIDRAIYRPAGMIASGPFEMDRDTPNLAFGYTHETMDDSVNLGEVQNNLFMHTVKGTPAGGTFSTVPDLIRFADALRSHRLLKKETLDVFTQPGGGDIAGAGYGLGFQLRPIGKELSYGHSGGFPGISADLLILPSGYVIVALANYDLEAMRLTGRLRMLVGDAVGW